MCLLYLRARPIVSFNPNNPDHRKYYRDFLEKKTWGACPVRFMVEGLTTDLVSHIHKEMLNWYVRHEAKNAETFEILFTD